MLSAHIPQLQFYVAVFYINFFAPRSNVERATFTSQATCVAVAANDVVVFPSWMQHFDTPAKRKKRWKRKLRNESEQRQWKSKEKVENTQASYVIVKAFTSIHHCVGHVVKTHAYMCVCGT